MSLAVKAPMSSVGGTEFHPQLPAQPLCPGRGWVLATLTGDRLYPVRPLQASGLEPVKRRSALLHVPNTRKIRLGLELKGG